MTIRDTFTGSLDSIRVQSPFDFEALLRKIGAPPPSVLISKHAPFCAKITTSEGDVYLVPEYVANSLAIEETPGVRSKLNLVIVNDLELWPRRP